MSSVETVSVKYKHLPKPDNAFLTVYRPDKQSPYRYIGLEQNKVTLIHIIIYIILTSV